MPVAFLSHSSKDKSKYVQIVANRLAKHCRVYDDDTFEYGMKTFDEIFRGLDATDLFVLFISGAALESEWVKKEILAAKANEEIGRIRRIFPLIIDNTITHSDSRIPQWMKDSYNLRFVGRPTQAVRLIQHRLRIISFEDSPRLSERKKIFVGRHEQVNAIEERFNDYDKVTPSCVIASGVPSIGRRSVLRHAIRKATSVPRDLYEPPHILLTLQDSIEDFILKVYDLGFSTMEQPVGLLYRTFEEKLNISVSLCQDIISANEFLLIEDNGCIVTYERLVARWFKEVVTRISESGRLFAVIASRFRPDFQEVRSDLLCHIQVPEMSPKERMGLFKRLSEFEGLNLSSENFNYFSNVLTGYPEQIQYLVALIRENGLHEAQRKTHLLVEFNSNKASVLVNSATHGNVEEMELLILLSEFEFISYELLSNFIVISKHWETLDRFFGAALCEQLGSNKEYIRVNDVIRDHVRRLKLGFPEKYKYILIEHVSRFVNTFTPEEVDASDYIFSLQRAILKGETVPLQFLIPSHFLKAIKELYDQHRNYNDVIKLADQVINSSKHLDSNILREIRYYLCLSLARVKEKRFTSEVQHIGKPDHNFLLGFYYRMVGRVSEAIDKQKIAINEPRTASRARRELVQLYVTIEDYESALVLAERNHAEKPNNPYHVDALVKCLINLDNWKESESRIRTLLEELEGSKSDRSQEMFLNLSAQFHAYCLKDYNRALDFIEKAIENHANSPYPYFTKLTILFRQKNIEGVKDALDQTRSFLKHDGQFQDALIKMEAQYLALTGKISEAESLINSALRHIPEYAKTILYRKVSQLTISGISIEQEQF